MDRARRRFVILTTALAIGVPVCGADGPLLAADTSQPDLSGAQLFNLAEDVGEQRDLGAAQPEKVKELSADWLRWSGGMAKPLWGPGAGGRGRGGMVPH